MSLDSFLQDNDKTAMVWKDQEISYRNLLDEISKYSEKISDIKSLEFDKIAIFSENRAEWVYAFYATWNLGEVVLPLDYLSTATEISYILNDAKPSVVFCSAETEKVLLEAVELVTDEDYRDKIRILNFDKIVVPKDIKSVIDTIPFPKENPNKIAIIIYTSGTTGNPKGVMLTYDNLLINYEGVTEDAKIYDENQRTMVLLPVHHILPIVGTILTPLASKGSIYFSPSLKGPDIIDTLQKHKITLFIGVPRLFSVIRKGIKDKIDKSTIAKTLFFIAEKVNSKSFSKKIFKTVHNKFGGNIKCFVSGGAALDREITKDFTTLGFEILEGYGLTETAPMISFTRPGKVLAGSAGHLLSGIEVKTVDDEIVVKGRNLMKGYYNKEKDTADVIKDGWFYTGDLGFVDKDNRMFITGRKKEIIVLSNGKNINPEELEFKIIAKSNLISELAVFAVNDTLSALIFPDSAVVKELGIENIEDKIKMEVIDPFNKEVSPYKKVMKLFFIDEELPRTRLGKLKRFELNNLAANLSNLSEKNKVNKEKKTEPDYEEYKIIKTYLINESKKEDIEPDDHFEMDIGLDSLDKISFLDFLQNTFGVEMKEDKLLTFPTVHEISEYIKERKEKISVQTTDWGRILKEKIELSLPKRWFTHRIFKNVAKISLRSYFNIKSIGIENIPKDTPFIMTPNHQSFFDGLFVSIYLKRKIFRNTYFYAKEKHIKRRWVKFLAGTNNVIVMDISNNLKESIQKLAEVLKKGNNIIIFPEGTRTTDGEIGSFKKLFAILGKELKVPIVPVMISGANKALPKGSIIPRPLKSIVIEYLKPIYPEENCTYDSIVEKVRDSIDENLKKVKR